MQFNVFFTIAQAPPYPLGLAPACMKTNSLPINTGWNWRWNTEFWPGAGELDTYWRIISAQGTPTPVCATPIIDWMPPGWGPFNISRAISTLPNGANVPTNTNLICSNLTGNMFTFERRFYLDNIVPQTCTLANIIVKVDDQLVAVTINGMPTALMSDCWQTGNPISFPNFTFNAVPGVNVIQFNVINRPDPNNTSRMALNVEASILCPIPALIRNEYYVPNVDLGCVANPMQYLQTPTLVGTCVTALATSGNVFISNYDALYTYTLNGVSVGNSFSATLGNTYTITVNDAFGCSLSTVFTMTSTLDPPVVTMDNPLYCLWGGSFIIYSGSTTNGDIPYTYLVQNSPPATISWGPPGVGNYYGGGVSAIGTYTVTAIDVNGCTGTSSFVVGNNFNVNITTSTSKPCIDLLGTINLIANTTPAVGSLYSIDGINFQASNIFTVNTPGMYTITVKDAAGCSASSTIEIHLNPTVAINENTYPTCNTEFTATALIGGPLTYQWGLPPYNPLITNNAQAWPQNVYPDVPGQNPINIYLVMGTDAYGCTGTATINWAQDEFCCNDNNYANLPYRFSSQTLPSYNNNTASDIITAFGMGNVITANWNTILLDGNIVIDQDITFKDCYQIRLTANTQITINPGVTLTLDNSSLRANCNELWSGIYVGQGRNLIIKNDSYLWDMNNGVVSISGGKIDITNSNFNKNYYCIQIFNAPVGFNANTNSCIIKNNVFQGNYGYLLYPRENTEKTESAIRVVNCEEVEIGGLNGGGNHFISVYNGIFIQPMSITQTENYYMYDNKFYQINNGYNNTPDEAYFKALNWSFSGAFGHRGTGIYCRPNFNISNMANHTAFIIDDEDGVTFEKCDRCVMLNATSAVLEGNNAKNCILGYMFNRMDNQNLTLDHNTVSGVNDLSGFHYESLLGTKISGQPRNCVLDFNQYYMSDHPKLHLGNLNLGFYPVAIDIENWFNTNNSRYKLKNNYIDLNCAGGVGILLRNTNKNTDVVLNPINFNNTWPIYSINDMNRLAAGLYVENADGTSFRGNYVVGNNSMLNPVNQVDAMRMSSSKNCLIECNTFHTMRRGLRILSNCATAMTNVRGNTFNTLGYAMEFIDNGTQATLGNQGDYNNDNNNIFYNSALFPPNTYGIYRKVTIPFFNDRIYTTYVPQTYSWSDQPFGQHRYIIEPNGGATKFQWSNCNNIPPMMLAYMISSIDSSTALEIAADSSNNGQYTEAVSWMENQRLFNALSGGDSILLSNAELATFYQNQLLTYSDELYRINELFNILHDSTTISNAIEYNDRLYEVETINNSIAGSNHLELNEKAMNAIYIKMLKGVYDSVSVSIEDSSLVCELANSCPFVNGNGVYKARMLVSMLGYSAMQYSDLGMCQAAGMYKNSGNTSEEPEIDLAMLNALKSDYIKVYPNPVTNQLTLAYDLQGSERKFVLYDLLGREQMNIMLNGYSNKTTTTVQHLAKGVYIYKYIVGASTITTGKLIKE